MTQLMLPLDERFRIDEQLRLPLVLEEQPPKQVLKPEVYARVRVCIGNCNICPYCDNSNNR